MEENKRLVSFPCISCRHAVVCTHRGELAILADYLETPVNDYLNTSKDTFPNELISVNVCCKFYDSMVATSNYVTCHPQNYDFYRPCK